MNSDTNSNPPTSTSIALVPLCIAWALIDFQIGYQGLLVSIFWASAVAFIFPRWIYLLITHHRFSAGLGLMGFASNIAVCAVNGGYMPVLNGSAGPGPAGPGSIGPWWVPLDYNIHHLTALADIMPVKSSIGDLFIAGAFIMSLIETVLRPLKTSEIPVDTE